MTRLKILILLIVVSSSIHAQKVDRFDDRYLPAKPYGGDEEVQLLFNNALVYPQEALEKNIEGDVFINYIINTDGKLIEYTFDNSSPKILQEAAIHVFKRILWEPYPNEPKSRKSEEKIKVSFKIKKYNKLLKKRSDQLPANAQIADSSFQLYTINQVDQKPQARNAESVNDYVYDHFKFPSIALERGISGRVGIEFVIEPAGYVSNVRITEPLAGGCNDETIRLMRGIAWEAGKVNGRAVRTLYKYELNFVNPGGSIGK